MWSDRKKVFFSKVCFRLQNDKNIFCPASYCLFKMFLGNNSSITAKKVTRDLIFNQIYFEVHAKNTYFKNRKILVHLQTVITFEPEESVINFNYSKLCSLNWLSITFFSFTSHTYRNAWNMAFKKIRFVHKKFDVIFCNILQKYGFFFWTTKKIYLLPKIFSLRLPKIRLK